MPAKIRRFQPADRQAVIQAFRTNVPHFFPPSEEKWLKSCLDEPDGPLFVVVDEGEVVAFGGYELSEFYHLGTLVFGLVRADRHGTGIGRMLLHYRLRHMAGRKLRPRYVTVDTHAHTAGFFLRCGFTEIARWPGGYRSGRDRVDLRFELSDEALEMLKVAKPLE
ncbi:GNAT family N-acetyltransferase [Noviherbaspirillum galbum]|uniref:GNAT family N-acetyltransferase n=1 Tax=Noviherbaspirillum galbum TaxID=2709383 RepID=A0A6B3SP73_9BURK|nr:GNAT family N-acetyltransferase [Noviherbaspirillum galbum]NEX59519.1 GNAT family N-acetyltransferase [Noviherbaspirillum galbum]